VLVGRRRSTTLVLLIADRAGEVVGSLMASSCRCAGGALLGEA
jgi:hypothetical protein